MFKYLLKGVLTNVNKYLLKGALSIVGQYLLKLGFTHLLKVLAERVFFYCGQVFVEQGL